MGHLRLFPKRTFRRLRPRDQIHVAGSMGHELGNVRTVARRWSDYGALSARGCPSSRRVSGRLVEAVRW